MAAIRNIVKQDSLLKGCAMLLVSGLFIAVTFGTSLAVSQGQMTFAFPEEAAKALMDALRSDDTKALSAIFGPGSEDVFSSGDPVADKTGHQKFVNLYEQKNRLEETDAYKVVLYVGKEDWPL